MTARERDAAVRRCEEEMARILAMETDVSPSALMGVGDWYVEKCMLEEMDVVAAGLVGESNVGR